MLTEKMMMMGGYALAAFDAAASRGFMSDAALQTLIRGLSEMHAGPGGRPVGIGSSDASGQGSMEIPHDTRDLLAALQKQQADLLRRATEQTPGQPTDQEGKMK